MNWLDNINKESKRSSDYRIDLKFNDIRSVVIFMLSIHPSPSIKFQLTLDIIKDNGETFNTTIISEFYTNEYVNDLINNFREWLERYEGADYIINYYTLHVIAIKDVNNSYYNKISNIMTIHSALTSNGAFNLKKK